MEVLGLDATAEQVLWQWLLSMDLIGAVRGWRGPTPHPLQLWLQEPRRLEVTVSDNPWLRILDLSTALAARTYAVPGSVVLEVDDDLIESNAGRWQLSVPGSASGMGMPTTVTRTTGEPDLVLATAALATVYLGAFRFGDLARAGMVRECHPGALDTADLLFNTSRAPWCSTPF
jgi:predicted acetyltransferase